MEHHHEGPPSLHAGEARNAPALEFPCLACPHEGTGVDEPVAVVDAGKDRIVRETPMTAQFHPLAVNAPMPSPQPVIARGLGRALAMAAALVAATAALVVAARAQAAPTITEFTVGLTLNSFPFSIAADRTATCGSPS